MIHSVSMQTWSRRVKNRTPLTTPARHIHTHTHTHTHTHILKIFVALKPGEVQNLRSTLNTSEASLILNWDQPNNVITAGDVTAYDIRLKHLEVRVETVVIL